MGDRELLRSAGVSVPMEFWEEGPSLLIRFVGRAGEENGVLVGATAYQSITWWKLERPPAGHLG